MSANGKTRPTLSVAIIAKNEEANLEACLESVQWADEIVVIDSGSTDQTVDIARRMGARVIETPDWPGFGRQKNRSLDATRCDWILTIDADERVSDALKSEIQAAVAQDKQYAYSSPRLTFFMGQPVRHGGWYPDAAVRLFRRGRARFTDHLVHEGLLVDDPVQMLRGDLFHYSYQNRDDVERKLRSYSRAGGAMLRERGVRPWPATPALKAVGAWIRTYIIRRGFLDGCLGLRIAKMSARASYLKYFHARQIAE
jgi:glycosyltransferase involved in cell wall biosynthesis